MKGMKRFLYTIFIFAYLLSGCQSFLNIRPTKKVTVLDRVVHIEDSVITEIPKISRWCDELDLKKSWIRIGPCEFYVEEEGEGIPVVLINGGPGGTHHTFHPEFSRASTFAKIIYYDQRGCGLSDYIKGDGYTVAQAVDDLEALREILKIEKWIVLGWSYGGFLGQYYVMKHPDRIAGLVLVGSALTSEIPLEPTREYDYISQEEIDKRREFLKMLREEKLTLQQYLFNAHLNGDWKRQNYYRPTQHELARMALYEWAHDEDFRNEIWYSRKHIYLGGAFKECPIPILITEGKWDLTWNIDKPVMMQTNFPQAKIVLFQHSGHRMFGDEPNKFFKELHTFLKNLLDVSERQIAEWKEYLDDWNVRKSNEVDIYQSISSLWESYDSDRNIVAKYKEDWLNNLKDQNAVKQIAYALYDFKKYDESLHAFQCQAKIIQSWKDREKAKRLLGFALIWQGHILDLLGKHEEAVSVYQRVVDMRVEDENWSHSSYGIEYKPTVSGYAKERIQTPFKRKERSY